MKLKRLPMAVAVVLLVGCFAAIVDGASSAGQGNLPTATPTAAPAGFADASDGAGRPFASPASGTLLGAKTELSECSIVLADDLTPEQLDEMKKLAAGAPKPVPESFTDEVLDFARNSPLEFLGVLALVVLAVGFAVGRASK